MSHLASLVAVASIAAFAGCGPGGEECYSGHYLNITHYGIVIDEYTPKGIGLDQPSNPEFRLLPGEIDWQVDELERCIQGKLAENPIISEDDAAPENGWCIVKDFSSGFAINRGCISVKVPDDIYHSKCSDQWLFPCNVNPDACRAKGIEPTEECPCHCRAMVQDDNAVITNHELNVFRGELARIVTNCNNPWVVGQFSGCLTKQPYKGE